MVIALLTDFGTKDYFVGAMKGAILTINPQANILDITHDIDRHDVRSAAFNLKACLHDFPPQTIFVAVVDPGVGSARRPIIASAYGRFFVAPDNGLLSPVIDGVDPQEIFEISDARFTSKTASHTFHGRDIFAPAAAHLSLGVAPSEFGPAIGEIVTLDMPQPIQISPGVLRGEVINIDSFGNLVTNLITGELPEHFQLTIAGRTINHQAGSYSEGRPGELFVIEGSAGFIEISVNGGSAADTLSAAVGERFEMKI